MEKDKDSQNDSGSHGNEMTATFLEVLSEAAKDAGRKLRLASYDPELLQKAADQYSLLKTASLKKEVEELQMSYVYSCRYPLATTPVVS